MKVIAYEEHALQDYNSARISDAMVWMKINWLQLMIAKQKCYRALL